MITVLGRDWRTVEEEKHFKYMLLCMCKRLTEKQCHLAGGSVVAAQLNLKGQPWDECTVKQLKCGQNFL